MKILMNCFKVSSILSGSGGVGVFIRSIIPFLAKKSDIYLILATDCNKEFKFNNVNTRFVNELTLDSVSDLFTWCDLYFDPQNGLEPKELPFDLKIVSCLHDLQHTVNPNFFSKEVLKARDLEYTWTIHRSDAMLCISKWEYKLLQQHFGKVQATIIGHAPYIYDMAKSPNSKITYNNSKGEDFYLYPAVSWPHKNQIRLIRAFNLVNLQRKLNGKSPIKLILVGSLITTISEFIKDHISILDCYDYIEHYGYVPDDILISLYKKCTGIIFPSAYEGFGIPILESLAFEKPILASPLDSIREKGGSNINYFRNIYDEYLMSDDIANFINHSKKEKYLNNTDVSQIVDDLLLFFNEVAFNSNNDKTIELKALSTKKYSLKVPCLIITTSTSEENIRLLQSNILLKNLDVIYIIEYTKITSLKFRNNFNLPGKYFYAKKGDLRERNLLLDYIIQYEVKSDYLMYTSISTLPLIEVKNIIAICHLLNLRNDLAGCIFTSTQKLMNKAKWKMQFGHEHLNECEEKNEKFSIMYFENCLFKTWICCEGGMMGTIRRLKHFKNEKYLIL